MLLYVPVRNVVIGRCPAYLGSIVQPATQSRSGLRPSSSDFSVPRTRTKFDERAFSYAGPSAWNTLPRHIRETVDSASFRKLLKTQHNFTSAFGGVWFLQLFLSPFYIYIDFCTAYGLGCNRRTRNLRRRWWWWWYHNSTIVLYSLS